MNQAFFEDLKIPNPDVSLGVGSGTHATQTAAIMVEFEAWCFDAKPDVVVVVGDVNSTLACTLAARKLGISVAHVEAGLRSGDMSMPEEINRRCTDAVSNILFASEPSAVDNLRQEGHSDNDIHFVGNVMIDTLFRNREAASALKITRKLNVERRRYGVVTLHRPSNTDDEGVLASILTSLVDISRRIPLLFPMHPRTADSINRSGLSRILAGADASNLRVIEPMRYLEFIGLLQDARLVITDSGGMQEETTALGVPCLTMRENTERPITCEQGTNRLIGRDPIDLRKEVYAALERPWPSLPQIENWDGRAAQRIVRHLLGRKSSGATYEIGLRGTSTA
jgi:UDP-N-acetylglucosamine 2-epimerase (non-hydrolysing)